MAPAAALEKPVDTLGGAMEAAAAETRQPLTVPEIDLRDIDEDIVVN